MHILHILDHSIPLHSGYAFRSLAIINRQRALGWQTSHLTSTKHYAPGDAEEHINGLKFYRTPAGTLPLDRVPVLAQWLVIQSLARRLEAVCRKEKPDILHAHSPCLMGIAALRVGRRIGLPVIYEMRASWEDAAAHHGTSSEHGIRYKMSRKLETWVLRNADAVTTICDGLRAEIAGRGLNAEDITVVPNAVDASRFTERQPKAELAKTLNIEGRRVLGFAGSFYAYEGLAVLLQAMPRICAVNPDVCLLLVGGGPEDARLRAMTRDLGLENDVFFVGRVPHEQIGEIYDLVEIFVYPRLSSRLTDMVTPLKPLEAMAQRRPVIASDVGGHRELIKDGETGVLFEAGSPESLTDAVLGLLDDAGRQEYLRDAGRRYVESDRTWTASVAQYEPVYTRLLANARQT